jgi:CheY-like chemotaxis protein
MPSKQTNGAHASLSASDRRPLRLLLVDAEGGVGEIALAKLQATLAGEVETDRAVGLVQGLARLQSAPAVHVVLLDPEAPDMTTLQALAALHERAPDVPVFVLPSLESDHLAVAIEAVRRSPEMAPAVARRVAALRPRYLLHRQEDAVALREALEGQDFERMARIGHNMRGNGVSFGIPELSAIGEWIEAAAQDRSPSRLDAPIALLQARLARILRT